MKNTKCWHGCGEKQTHLPFVEMPWRTVQKCLRNLRTDVRSDPTLSLPDVNPKCKVSIPMTYLHAWTYQYYSHYQRYSINNDGWEKKGGLCTVEDDVPWRMTSFARKWVNERGYMTLFYLGAEWWSFKERKHRRRVKGSCLMDTQAKVDRRNEFWRSLAQGDDNSL